MQSTMTSRNERLIPSYDYTIQDAIEEYELAQNGRTCPNNNMPSKWEDLSENAQLNYILQLRRRLQEALGNIDMNNMAMDSIYWLDDHQGEY